MIRRSWMAGASIEAALELWGLGLREVKRVQCDEIWSFVGAKAKNVAAMKNLVEGAGDVWTWTAIDADSKLLVSWLVGGRDAEYALAFMDDVRQRLAHRVQLTTDGHKAYLQAVEGAFGSDVDYAQLVKVLILPRVRGHGVSSLSARPARA